MEAHDVRSLRARLQLTQEEFAKAIRYHVGQVKRWELGKAKPRAKACRAMGKLAARHGIALTAAVPAGAEVVG